MRNIHILVSTIDQLNTIVDMPLKPERIYVESSIVNEGLDIIKQNRYAFSWYLVGPFILREKDIEHFKSLLELDVWNGILVRNLETLSLICPNNVADTNYDIVLDSNMYVLNSDAYRMYRTIYDGVREYFGSFELNQHEISELNISIDKMYKDAIHSYVVYGKIPMMISANCLRKTNDECTQNRGFVHVTDRTNKKMSVYCNCDYCYNTIYNSVPISWHKYLDKFDCNGNFRIDFTDETGDYAVRIVEYFVECISKYREPFYKEFTTAHIKRGVE